MVFLIKKYGLFCFIFILTAITSCNKKEIVFDTNPSIYHPKSLIFHALTATNPYITPSTKTFIRANAVGVNLTYTWSASHGIIEGNGSEIQYSDTVLGTNTVYCEVKDKFNKVQSNHVAITITNELMFSALSATDTLMPLNFTDTITATASGEDITYNWLASEGNISGSGTKVTFTPPQYEGNFTLTCTVTDKYNHSNSKNLVLTTTNDLIFKSLIASPDSIVPNEISVVTAVAYGQGLSYHWESDVPTVTILGSGPSVTATLCHNQSFVITCNITDALSNPIAKSITIKMDDSQ